MPGLAFSQVDHRVFYTTEKDDQPLQGKMMLDTRTLGFVKNNEYFNDIADGYTLFGYHLIPSVVYFPSEQISVRAGILLWKDFGNDRYTGVQPVFNLAVTWPGLKMIFGNLEGPAAHKLIEPLYGFERQLVQPDEYGLQFIHASERAFADVWINWEDMLYRAEPEQEKISAGFSSSLHLLNREGIRLSLPFQFIARHHGGQIDASPLPLKTVLNEAAGFEISLDLSEDGFFQRIGSGNYFVGYHDLSKHSSETYLNGWGMFMNVMISTKLTDLNLGYWHGERYVAGYGGDIFSSVSTSFKHQGYTERVRDLVILSFTRDFRLLKNFYLSMRFEPFFDFRNAYFEFSNGLYLNYRDCFFLARPGK